MDRTSVYRKVTPQHEPPGTHLHLGGVGDILAVRYQFPSGNRHGWGLNPGPLGYETNALSTWPSVLKTEALKIVVVVAVFLLPNL